MVEFEREFFINDPVIGKVHEMIKEIHQVPDHTRTRLEETNQLGDIFIKSRHYVHMALKSDYYLHYDAESWFDPEPTISVRITSITFYDNWQEYEPARLRMLHGTIHSSINLN